MPRHGFRSLAPAVHTRVLGAALVLLFATLGLARPSALVGIAQAAPSHPEVPVRPAGGNDPTITWDGSMIFAGQNNGNPWGPVGEHAQVEGSKFPDGQYDLVLALGDVNGDASVCSSTVIPVGSPVAASGGTFTATFDWPAAANQVNAAYSICALNGTDHSVASTQDSGPFTVLSASAPVISLSTSSIAAGGSVTVTGQNFVPAQSVMVYASPCTSCGAPKAASVTVQSSGNNAGTFSATLPLPTTTAPNTYFVGAISANGVLGATEQTLVVTGAPTATPTAAATATPSPTATATAGPIPPGGGSNGNNSGLLLVLGIAALVLLAILMGLLAYLLTRRSAQARAGQGAPIGAYPPAAPYGATPPPLPMPDWEEGAAAQVEDTTPVNYDDPTEPGLGTPNRPRRP
jgi:hypothetical protein